MGDTELSPIPCQLPASAPPPAWPGASRSPEAKGSVSMKSVSKEDPQPLHKWAPAFVIYLALAWEMRGSLHFRQCGISMSISWVVACTQRDRSVQLQAMSKNIRACHAGSDTIAVNIALKCLLESPEGGFLVEIKMQNKNIPLHHE